MDIKSATYSILSDLDDFLKKVDDKRYSEKLNILLGSSIGMHTRHILEFYQCLISQSKDGFVNYDKRKRNNRIENYTSFASQVISEILEQINNFEPDTDLKLHSGFDKNVDEFEIVESNYKRELVYNLEHAIHHMAIIRIGARSIAPDIDMADSFGVAPSTIKHQKSLKGSY